MNSLLDREANAVDEVLSAACKLRCSMPEAMPRSWITVFDAGCDMLVAFGRSELNYRQADRWDEFGINPGASADARNYANRLQEIGIEAISVYRENLPRFARDLGELIASAEKNPSANNDLQRVKDELAESLAKLEVKRSDARELLDGLNSCIDIMAKLDTDEIQRFFDNAASQLEELRRRPDRGTIPNLAPWKFWAIVAVVGFFIAAAIVSVILVITTAGLAAPVLAAVIGGIFGLSSGSSSVIASTIKSFC